MVNENFRMSTEALQDRTIVIIGGTTGLGLSGALACVKEGSKVVVVGRNSDSAGAARDQIGTDRARAIVGDATDPETARRAIDEAITAFGRFDGLYHVAGGSGRSFGDGPLHELTDEGIQKTLDLNLMSMMRSNRAAVQSFLQRDVPGVVLNMGSVLGFSPSPAFFVTHAYAAAKSAVIGFTKSCAAYYANDGVRFNGIAPALVATPMARRAAGDEVIQQFIRTKQPLDGGRMGRPDDLDAGVVFLLSDQSKFVTGQTLVIDGGWTISEGQIPQGVADV